jgi:hypothetical protein
MKYFKKVKKENVYGNDDFQKRIEIDFDKVLI